MKVSFLIIMHKPLHTPTPKTQTLPNAQLALHNYKCCGLSSRLPYCRSSPVTFFISVFLVTLFPYSLLNTPPPFHNPSPKRIALQPNQVFTAPRWSLMNLCPTQPNPTHPTQFSARAPSIYHVCANPMDNPNPITLTLKP